MTSIAYLCNSFPEPSEHYFSDEVRELRQRGVRVVLCSFRRSRNLDQSADKSRTEAIYVFPLGFGPAIRATWRCLHRFSKISDLLWEIIRRPEPLSRRIRALAHTWLGAYLAVVLSQRHIRHFHVHHGFFAAWCGMAAARFLDAGFSVTLHGSDIFLPAAYLETKLHNCEFCMTVSEFNRRHIVRNYHAQAQKVVVHRLGVDLKQWQPIRPRGSKCFSILSVGRLHPVKNHGFLVLACHSLKISGVPFHCVIAGEGSERKALQRLIREFDLENQVELIGHAPRAYLPQLYADADAVVLTSLSEGIPMALMEAMAMERVVLAPNITGIPELIQPGESGFLYQSGCMDDFLAKLALIREGKGKLDGVRHAARVKIEKHFDAERNLSSFADGILSRIDARSGETAFGTCSYEDSLLQQIQLRVQRDRSLPV